MQRYKNKSLRHYFSFGNFLISSKIGSYKSKVSLDTKWRDKDTRGAILVGNVRNWTSLPSENVEEITKCGGVRQQLPFSISGIFNWVAQQKNKVKRIDKMCSTHLLLLLPFDVLFLNIGLFLNFIDRPGVWLSSFLFLPPSHCSSASCSASCRDWSRSLPVVYILDVLRGGTSPQNIRTNQQHAGWEGI
jgi:hypothetical protein